jgi:hypothetical protein
MKIARHNRFFCGFLARPVMNHLGANSTNYGRITLNVINESISRDQKGNRQKDIPLPVYPASTQLLGCAGTRLEWNRRKPKQRTTPSASIIGPAYTMG